MEWDGLGLVAGTCALLENQKRSVTHLFHPFGECNNIAQSIQAPHPRPSISVGLGGGEGKAGREEKEEKGGEVPGSSV